MPAWSSTGGPAPTKHKDPRPPQLVWEAMVDSFVALLFSGALGGLGVWLAAMKVNSGQPETPKVVGGLLVALAASVATGFIGNAYAKRGYGRSLLRSLGLQLSQAAGEIQASNIRHQSREDADETLHESISQSVRVLYAVVSQLEDLVDEHLDASGVASTASSVQGGTERLRRVMSASETMLKTVDEIVEEAVRSDGGETEKVKELRSRLAGIATELKSAVRQESWLCPNCGTQIQFDLAELPGATQTRACPRCGHAFHAHRGSDGSVVVNRGASPTRLVSVPCPNPDCPRTIELRMPLQGSGTMDRWCLGCFERITLAIPTAELEHSCHDEPLEATAVGRHAGRTVLRCPADMVDQVSFARVNGVCYAVCPRCGRLLRAPDDVQTRLEEGSGPDHRPGADDEPDPGIDD